MKTNTLAKTRWSSPDLISVEHAFDAAVAAAARARCPDVPSEMIDLFEALWRGERGAGTLYSVFHLGAYERWATAVNKLADERGADR